MEAHVAGIASFLHDAKNLGLDRQTHWEIQVSGGDKFKGPIVDIWQDVVIIEQRVNRMQGYEGDRVEICVPFSAIVSVRRGTPATQS
jgi:hypothetical protein